MTTVAGTCVKVIITASILFIVATNCAIPDYIKVCHKNDPKLAECIKNSVYNLKPRLKTGIPDLDVPSLEPLRLGDMHLGNGPETARFDANLTQLVVRGATDFNILELRPNLAKNLFQFSVNIPKLFVEGTYEADMSLLFVKIVGKGPITVNITDYRFTCSMKGHKVKKNGLVYLEFGKMKLDLVVGGAKIHLQNLFRGDKVLEEATNEVINENVDLFLGEIKPALINALSEKFTDIANKITLTFSYDELFL